ncbi:MAG: ROK family protein [Phycisphaeraceae bacterium]|nr:ROK family protein [Phycisphaeraceae bacterium]MCW5761689.1 ROK family protein [Phycisphaeraceae bacterium]
MTTTPDLPQGLIAGVDLGGTNIQFGIVDHRGRILGRAKDKTPTDQGMEVILDRIVLGIRAAAKDAQVQMADLIALGLGAPGPVDPVAGIVREAVNLRWTMAPVGELLMERLGMPVVLDNDVNVAVYGEAHHGAGIGSRNLIGAWIGTGVGGGLILDGKLFYGHHFSAGELGHMLLYPNNPPGSRTIENICSRSAVVDRVLHLIRTNRKSMIPELLGDKFPKIKSKTLADAYRKGDELVIEVIDDAADRLGMALGSITTLLSLERIILGGGLTEALQDLFVDRVRLGVQRAAFPAVAKTVDVVVSKLDDDAGVIGAALLARQRLASVQA